jgi:hypothetical protein
MTAPSFKDLAQFGVVEKTTVELQEEIIHGSTVEEFLAHLGIDVPDEPTEEFYENTDKVLAHFGVLGMKWGRRRNRDGSVTVDKSKTAGNHPGQKDSKSDDTSDSKKTGEANPQKKSVKDLSDAELNAIINRMRLEQTYAQMTASKPNPFLAESKKIVGKALSQNAQTYLTAYTGVAADALITKMGGKLPKDIASQRAEAAKEAAKEEKDKS